MVIGSFHASSRTFDFDAGHLALDFANAADPRASGRERDWLPVYAEVLEWAIQAGTVGEELARDLWRVAEQEPGAAEAARVQMVATGKAIYTLFAGHAEGREPDGGALAELNAALERALAHRRLTVTSDGFNLGWAESRALDRPLWPVVDAAAALLASEELDRVRACGGDPCNWLFLDTSRNRSRRWCDMSSCGNRAKARRFYARQKDLA